VQKLEENHTGAPLTAPTVETEAAIAVLYQWQRKQIQRKSFEGSRNYNRKGLIIMLQLCEQKFISSRLVVESLTSTRRRLAWLPRGNYVVSEMSHPPTTIELEVGIEASS